MTDIATANETTVDASKALSFEAAVKKLESLVASLEGGDLGLEDSITAYEDGLRLARACIERLDDAELRVQQLTDLTDDESMDRGDKVDPAGE